MTPAELRTRTADFAADVALFVKPLFRRLETREAASQLSDAASSTAANYRAAGRARSRKEFSSKIGVVLEEVDESAYWLEHLIRTADLDAVKAPELLREALELVAIFSAARTTLGIPRPDTDSRARRKRRRPPNRPPIAD